MTNKLNFVCIDKRARDPQTGQIMIMLENGTKVAMPPHIQSVPALLLVKKNYSVLLGNAIIEHFQSQGVGFASSGGGAQSKAMMQSQSEPAGFQLLSSNQGMNIVSEPYTMYNLTPEELSTKGVGGRRQMYNYVSVNDNGMGIPTPDDTYKPDKVSKGVTVEELQQQRNAEIQRMAGSGAATAMPNYGR